MDVLRRTGAMVSLPNISARTRLDEAPSMDDGFDSIGPIKRSRSDPVAMEFTDAQKKGVELGLRLSTILRTVHEGRTVTDRFRDAETMLLGADAEHDELVELYSPSAGQSVSGMSRSLSGLSTPQFKKSLCKMSLLHTIENEPTNYKYPFVLNHSGAFGLWGQKFAAAKFLEVAKHIMGVDSVYADGGASGVKPILMEDYVLKYLTMSEAPHQFTLIERMREEEARPTLITPTLFFFGPLPPKFHADEGGEQFTTMQIAVNIAHCLSDLPPQFLDGAEVTCFDLKGNFLYTDEQRQEDSAFCERTLPSNVPFMVWNSRMADESQGTKKDTNFRLRFPLGLIIEPIDGSTWYGQDPRKVFEKDIRVLQSQQFIDYSLFVKYILPPEGYSNEQVDAALVGLVVGGSRGHGRSHRVEPVFKATDRETGRSGVVVMGIIDQLYHPGDRVANDFSQHELRDLDETSRRWRSGNLPASFTPDVFRPYQVELSQHYGLRQEASLQGGGMLNPHRYGERFLDMLTGDSKEAGFQYFCFAEPVGVEVLHEDVGTCNAKGRWAGHGHDKAIAQSLALGHCLGGAMLGAIAVMSLGRTFTITVDVRR